MMHSLKLVFYLAGYLLQALVFAAPQEDTATALPAAVPNLGGPDSDASACEACYVVADVDAVVWYSEVFVNIAATRVLNVNIGNNTRTTRTSTIINEATFTIEPNSNDEDGGVVALTTTNYDSTLVTNSAILYSPTPYNVFSAYTIRSRFISDGSCVSVTNPPVTLPTAYSQPIIPATGVVYLNEEGEQAFLDYLKITGCSRGGGNTTPIVVAQITDSTLNITNFQTGGFIAISTPTLGRTTNPVSTRTIGTTTLSQVISTSIGITTLTRVVSSGTSGFTTLTQVVSTVSVRVLRASRASLNRTSSTPTSLYYPSVRAPLIVIGSTTTITPTPNPLPLPIANGPLGPQGRGSGSITVEFVVPTGGPGGGNFTTVAVVPFINRGITLRKAGSSWAELSVAIAVGLCCGLLLYL